MPATPELVVVIGAGSIGQAIARRIGVGKTIMLADLNEKAAATAAETLQGAGFTTSSATVDVASHESVRTLAATASDLGAVTDVVHTARLSPAQASPEAIIRCRPGRRGLGAGGVRPGHRGRQVRRRHRQPS